MIGYELHAPAEVRLTVHDRLGRTVRVFADGPYDAGRHDITWNGRDDSGAAMASGLYLYRLEAGGISRAGKMTLVR